MKFITATIAAILAFTSDATLLPRAVLGTTSLNSTVSKFPTFLDDPNLAQAIAAWDHRDCNSDYFEPTPENLKASEADSWYLDAINNAKRENPEFLKRFGEQRLFARVAYSEMDTRCGNFQKGCKGVPTCRNIVKHTIRHNQNMALSDALDLSRKIYHAQGKISGIADNFHQIHEWIAATYQIAGLRADKISRDFSPQNDDKIQLACKLVREIFDTMLAFATAAAGDLKNSPFTGIPATIISEAIKWTGNFVEMERVLRPGVRGGELVNGMETPAFAEGMCASVGGDVPDETYARAGSLKNEIANRISEHQYLISVVLDAILTGQYEGKSSSSLYDLMTTSTWSRDYEEGLSQPFAEAQKQATDNFTHRMIMAMLSNSQCYVACTSKHNENGVLCSSAYEKTIELTGRTCYPDGHACQAECWSSVKNRGNHVQQLRGLGSLGDYGLDLQTIVDKSYASYKKYGLNPDTGSAEHFTARVMGKDRNEFGLPVCQSSLIKLNKVDGKGAHNKRKDHHHFPATCGNDFSNETALFMPQIGMGPKNTNMLNRLSWETHESMLAYNIKPFLPYTRYAALCENHVKFPQKGDLKRKKLGKKLHLKPHDLHRLHSGVQEARCDQLKEETKDMTIFEANVYFCKGVGKGRRKGQGTAKEVFKRDRGHAETAHPGFLKSHKKACQKFNNELKKFGKNHPGFTEQTAKEGMRNQFEDPDDEDQGQGEYEDDFDSELKDGDDDNGEVDE